MSFTVKDVAAMAGVSVRTLHHYDHIGLLKPHAVSEAGYRLYGEQELERLQQILFHRELGFALAEIRTIMDRPDFDRVESLRSHRAALAARRKRLGILIGTIDRTITSLTGEVIMEGHKLFEGFD
ncbi:MAG TPA: MerR family transcriptional regulator, partial [Spirochaetia bacterium]|nr:MerR family transcriptional regulator [Spirochaetia bacterium]